MVILQDNHGYVVELQKLPAGSPPGLGPSHLDTLNKLREFRHKGQNAVVFDDQVIFILKLTSCAFLDRPENTEPLYKCCYCCLKHRHYDNSTSRSVIWFFSESPERHA